MLALNIFKLIEDLFGIILTPFEWIRLTLAKQSLKFKREGTEDRA